MFLQFSSTHGRAFTRKLSEYCMALAALLLTLVTPGIFAQVTHVSNPYEGAVGYVSSNYAKEVASAISVTSELP
jgi:hypothetical protein